MTTLQTLPDQAHALTDSPVSTCFRPVQLPIPHIDLDMVIPAFNEVKRLPETLCRAITYLEGQPWRSRIVVVDNGSVDDTAAVVRAVRSDRVETRVIGCSRPGKGAAVRRGLLASTAPVVGFIDADLSTPLETLSLAMDEIQRGAAAVVASRYAPGGQFVQPQPFGRRIGGTAFRLMARGLVSHVHDTQCGFKFFRRDVVHLALQRCELNCFAFDVELLQRIQSMGEQIIEVPVAWTDDTRSTLRPIIDGLTSFTSLVKLYRSSM